MGLSVLFLSMFCYAGIKQDLYIARVAVSSQSQSSINVALKQSFRQVLIKVSGDPQIVESSSIKQGIRRANEFLQQFTFDTLDGKLWYQAQYDKDKVNQLIVNAGYPVWGEFRPTALMWFAVEHESSQQRILLDEFTESDFKLPIIEVADRRGISIHYPLMDIIDVQSVTLFDVWGRFDEIVSRASERYLADAIVIARLFPQKLYLTEDEKQQVPQLLDVESGQSSWQLDWLYMQGKQRHQGSDIGAIPAPLIEKMSTQIANLFAYQFAVRVDQQNVQHNQLEIALHKVQRLEDFVAVEELFNTNPLVQRISLLSVSDEVAQYRIHLMGTQEDLERSLLLNNNLTRRTDEFGQPIKDLAFLWSPQR